jgi:hypothetical protein
MAASKGVYGEATGEWSAADALGFSTHRRAHRHVPSPGWRARDGTGTQGNIGYAGTAKR